MKTNDFLIDINGYALSFIEKILDADIKILGKEYINNDNPKIFVANHFTRYEAMLLPYYLYHITNKKVGVIADDSLFNGYFSSFLKSIGAMPKSTLNRNNIIISDLLRNKKHWLIFPEGSMIKSRQIEKVNSNYSAKIENKHQRVHTGASYFALYSELIRQNYFNNNIVNIKNLKKKFLFDKLNEIIKDETLIIPINITYSNMRAGDNFIKDMANNLFDNVNDKMNEELEIEGNLILNSKMTIKILKPVNTKDYLSDFTDKGLNYNKVINKYRYKLTKYLMDDIYKSFCVNFEHIFILVLYLYDDYKINIQYFKKIIFLSIENIINSKIFFDKDIKKDLIYLMSYQKHSQFESILKQIIKDKIVHIKNDDLIINKKNFNNSHTHNTIRIKNISKVILNEIIINNFIIKIIQDLFDLNTIGLNKNLVNLLKKMETKTYIQEYKKYSKHKNLKANNIGKSVYLNVNTSKTCAVLIHGFSSSPKEMEDLGMYLKTKDINCIIPRLSGHGIVEESLKNKSYKNWYDSVCLSIAIAKLKYEKIHIIGFSAGGLLALLLCSKSNVKFSSVVTINAALELKDIRAKTLLPMVSFYSEIYKIFNKNTNLFDEYVSSNSENKDINYNKHYINALIQLKQLMKKTKSKLSKVSIPILVIQAKNDPVVDVSSAYQIYQNISSFEKKIILLKNLNHVVVKGNDTAYLFNCIDEFLEMPLTPN